MSDYQYAVVLSLTLLCFAVVQLLLIVGARLTIACETHHQSQIIGYYYTIFGFSINKLCTCTYIKFSTYHLSLNILDLQFRVLM